MSGLAAVVFLSAMLSSPLNGYEREEIPGAHVYSAGWSGAEREAVVRSLPPLTRRLEGELAKSFSGPIDVILVPGQRELRRVVEWLSGRPFAAENVLGVAVPGVRTLVVRAPLPPSTDRFDTTLAHEVAHLLIHEGEGGPPPRWLDEGIATWVSRPRRPHVQEGFLAFLARTGGLYRLEDLERRFPGGHTPTTVAYQQSYLVIQFLTERYGRGVVPRLLEAASTDRRTEDILRAATGRPAREIEENFRLWVANRESLLVTILSIFNLWTIAALLAIVAIARHRLRTRRLRQQLDDTEEEEEEEEDEPGSE